MTVPNFSYPYILLGLLLLPALWWHVKKQAKKQTATLLFSNIKMLPIEKTWRLRLKNLPLVFRLLAIGCCIVALARPVHKNDIEIIEGQGIDIVLCIDVSGSMLAQDFKPNRLEAARQVALDFIEKRKGDRIGLVIFSGESFTLCPLTTDKAVLQTQIRSFNNGALKDGTVIGAGLATAVDRLKNSNSKSKVVILMTDGEDNGGSMDPQTAKEIAKTFNVRVYTIGIGSSGFALMPYQTPLGTQMVNEKVSIDEALLKQIAAETNAQYFRATDNAELQNIYGAIDKLEKSKVQSTTFHKLTEAYYPWAWAALALVFIELLLSHTVFKKFP